MLRGIKITPTDKKLLKSSKVRKWFKYISKEVEIQLKEQNVEEKIIDSIALDVPLEISTAGKIKIRGKK